MTILGKLLTFFCLLAVGAFAYFATQDRAGRQTITAAALRHRILVEGLPFGTDKNAPAEMPTDADPDAEVPFVLDQGGGQFSTTVSRPLLETYFKDVPGPAKGPLAGAEAVPNQLAEVRRVKAKIDALGADAGNVAVLTNLLRDQPTSYEERVDFLRLRDANDAKGLKDRLDARFAAVLNPPAAPDLGFTAEAVPDLEGLNAELSRAVADLDKARVDPKGKKDDVEARQRAVDDRRKAVEEAAAKLQGRADKSVSARSAAPGDESERRVRLAHLLVHLDRDAGWQKRVLAVVGVREYARAVSDQAARLGEMVARPGGMIPTDLEGYYANKGAQERLARPRTTLANTQAELRRKWVEQKRKEDDLVGQRQTELKRILAQYDKVKAEVDDLLAKQAVVEAALFEVQREVAITLDEVYRLYDVLDARERDLLGAAPRP